MGVFCGFREGEIWNSGSKDEGIPQDEKSPTSGPFEERTRRTGESPRGRARP